jgi:ATP adenylyltransferase
LIAKSTFQRGKDTMATEQPATTIDNTFVLSKFDALTKSGLVQFDDSQKIVEHIDGDLKV